MQLQDLDENVKRKKNIGNNPLNKILKKEIGEIQKKIASGLTISVTCDFCNGPVYGNLRF